MKSPQWRKILKVTKPLIEKELDGLEFIGWIEAVLGKSSVVQELKHLDTLENYFDILLRSVPERILLNPDFTDWRVNDHINGLENSVGRSFEEGLK